MFWSDRSVRDGEFRLVGEGLSDGADCSNRSERNLITELRLMETRGRAVSRVTNIRAPLVECLEERKLLSIVSSSNVSEGFDGVQTGEAIIISASSPTGGTENSAVANTTNLSGSALTSYNVTSSVSGMEASPAATSAEQVSTSSLSTAPVEGKAGAQAQAPSGEDSSSSSPLAAENQSPAVTWRTEDSSAMLGSVRPSAASTRQEVASLSAEDLALTSGSEPASSALPLAQSAAASLDAGLTQSSGAEEDGSAASQQTIDEPDQASQSFALMDDTAVAGTQPNSSAPAPGGAAGSASGKAAMPAGNLAGLSVSSSQGEGLAIGSRVSASNQAKALEGGLTGNSAAESGSNSISLNSNDPEPTAAGQGQVDGTRPGDEAPVPRLAELPSDAAPLAVDSPTMEGAIDAPRPADLLTSFLPFDRASVESAVDAFLEQFEGLGADLTDFAHLGPVVPGIVAVGAVTAFSTVMLRRRRYRSWKQESNANIQGALDLLTSPSNLWKLGEI